MNYYKEVGKQLLTKGITALPARYGSKAALLTGWTEFFDRKPTRDEMKEWADLKEANLDILLGRCSNLVALDIDTDKPEILDLIKHLLPESPVVKRGAKGETRFFRYVGDVTEMLKFNGECILEVLSDNKKTTMGLHSSGVEYKYTSEKTLLNINASDLPVLPPALIAQLQLILKNSFGDGSVENYGRVTSGRNATLSSELGRLLSAPHSIEQIVKDLIKFDIENNVPPYFTDIEEHEHSEPYSNAVVFYGSHLKSHNSKRFKKNETYITPINTETTEVVQVKKSLELVKPKRKKPYELIPADSVIKTILDNINVNSWVIQPDLALGAILALGATLCSRKFMFEGMTTNMYILGIANSGGGKNQGLEFVKQLLIEIGADRFLGAGDMASDAGITDTMAHRPTLLYPIDEMGGVLKTITAGKSEYNGKMADILAELYTCSTSRYLGRALAEGIKGAIDRPHLNILGATTPTGFRQGVSRSALDKGLLGRFLVFFGEPDVPSTRVRKVTKMPQNIINQLTWLASYNPEESAVVIQGRQQWLTELEATEDANKELDALFLRFDKVRLDNQNEVIAPIAARLYQQSIKLMIIHAMLNANRELPKINVVDVKFGESIMLSFFENFKEEIDQLIFNSPIERSKGELKKVIKDAGGLINKAALIKATPHFTSNVRDAVLNELIESNQLEQIRVCNKDKWSFMFQLLEGAA